MNHFAIHLKLTQLYSNKFSKIDYLGMHLTKTIIRIGTSTPMFLAALFPIAKTWKPPKGPSTNEKDVIHKYHGRILSLKKE